jgi:hypothetical protein
MYYLMVIKHVQSRLIEKFVLVVLSQNSELSCDVEVQMCYTCGTGGTGDRQLICQPGVSSSL